MTKITKIANTFKAISYQQLKLIMKIPEFNHIGIGFIDEWNIMQTKRLTSSIKKGKYLILFACDTFNGVPSYKNIP